jgi:hypothetical protein
MQGCESVDCELPNHFLSGPRFKWCIIIVIIVIIIIIIIIIIVIILIEYGLWCEM